MRHDRLIDRFKKARAECGVRLKGDIDDLFCNFIFRHGSTTIISRKGAKTQRKTKNPKAAAAVAPCLQRTSSPRPADDDARSAGVECKAQTALAAPADR